MTTKKDQTLLKEVFGYSQFRDGQLEAIRAFSSGRDVQILMPTGGGKSLCFQFPAVAKTQITEGLCLVVSPLISLMEDQVMSMNDIGVSARVLHSAMTYEERNASCRDMKGVVLLYVSPERVAVKRFRRWLQEQNILGIAVDEAHCISEWGHDFRPHYLKLSVLKEEFNVPIMALTATATLKVMEEIRESLKLEDPLVIQQGFFRENILFSVEHIQGDRARLQRLYALLDAQGLGRKESPGRVVVYCAGRKRVRSVHRALRAEGYNATYYHAGRGDKARSEAQGAFAAGKTPIIVATTAFGMGIDQPDIRLVVHLQSPGTLESYYQQAGRAGRDGALSQCVLLYSTADALTHARIRGDTPTQGALAGWSALNDYIYGHRCRQLLFTEYFAGKDEGLEPCGCCDVCCTPEVVQESVANSRQGIRDRAAARDAVRAEADAFVLTPEMKDTMVAFVDGMVKPVSKRVVALGLRGSRSKRARRGKMSLNPHFGELKSVPEGALVRGVEQLLAEGRLAPRGKKYPTVWMPDKRVRPVRTGPKKEDKTTPLGRRLKNYRKAQARRLRWKAYQVFNNKTLNAIVDQRPSNLQALVDIPGMGPKRLARFGEGILAVVAKD